MIAWLLAVAIASEPCAMPSEPPPTLSVAWVSPLPVRAGNRRWLEVSPTRELAAWARANPNGTVGGLLRHVGLRKRARDPRRRFKIVIFDTDASALCRPIAEAEEGTAWGGLPTCAGGTSARGNDYTTCGYRTDYNSGRQGAEVMQARWKDLAPRGFCVVPADHFLVQSRR